MTKRPRSTTHQQVNLWLKNETERLLERLLDAKEEELGVSVSRSDYIELLVRQEAQRLKLKVTK